MRSSRFIALASAAALLTGWQHRWTGKAAAGLLTCYLVAMGLAGLAGGGLPIARSGSSPYTIWPGVPLVVSGTGLFLSAWLADIWVATRQNPHGPWSSPTGVAVVNTSAGDLTPGLSRDGRMLLWSAAQAARPSLGRQDIWMSTRVPGDDR